VSHSAYWQVARRRWQIVVAFAQLGVAAALIATEAFDSTRPLLSILIGLGIGVANGLLAVWAAGPPAPPRPTKHARSKSHAARQTATPIPARPRPRSARRQPRRHGTQHTVDVPRWPQVELAEYPRPTYPPPLRPRR
jgi:hypothetical protein